MDARWVLGVLACACACEPGEMVSLGTFRVVATRTGMTCGAQSAPYAPRAEFTVALQVAAGTLTWTPVGADPTRGTWNAPARVFRVFQDQDIVAWGPDRRRDIVGCVLHRSDVIEGTVEMSAGDAGVGGDAGAPEARSFTGTETIVFGVAQGGGDCRPIVGAGDGQFSTLPCEVTYSLDARRM